MYLFLVATVISILRGGIAYRHYLLQLVPFISLPAAAFLNGLFSSRIRWLTIVLVILALATSLKSLPGKYKWRISEFIVNQRLYYGRAYEIADYLKQKNILDESVYMMEDHIVLWLLNKKPLSKSITHPSNISNNYLLKFIKGENASTEGELGYILGQKPKYIIKSQTPWYLLNEKVANSLLEETLKNDYTMVKEIKGRQIYVRN